ncbi:MAG TPA: DUF4363 family protein [Clostridiales bacterium]|nr:DUF4363 family protein [Clostridiales bacterium]HXK84248.1 DUF4363 family protein [Clostridiales bacterium]
MKRFYISLAMLASVIAFSIYGHVTLYRNFERINEDLKQCVEALEKEDEQGVFEHLSKAEKTWDESKWLIGSVYSHQTKIEMRHLFLLIRELAESGDKENFKEKTEEMIAYIQTSIDSIAVSLYNIF